jgi:predicted phosphodiesterase
VRVAVLADVHGNASALEAVLAEVERERPDAIVSCGDLTWGPELRDYVSRTRPQVTIDVDGLGPTLFCHGSPRSDEECVTAATPPERVAEFAAGVLEACIVTAHTHMQYDRRVEDVRLLNPGSVGLPYEPEPGHAYWALLGSEVELRRTPYDLEAALERMRAAGMPAFERIEELLRTPPPHAEVIEHAERVVFSG